MTIVMIIVGFFFPFILVSFHRNDGGQDGVGPKVPTLLPVQSFSQHWLFSFVLKKRRKKNQKEIQARRKGELWEGREKNSFRGESLSSGVILNCHSQKQTNQK